MFTNFLPIPHSAFVYACMCLGVCKSSRVCLPSPSLALQLVSLSDPSCNGDISAPVLAGEEEGEYGDYLKLSQPSEEPRKTASDIFKKHLSHVVERRSHRELQIEQGWCGRSGRIANSNPLFRPQGRRGN